MNKIKDNGKTIGRELYMKKIRITHFMFYLVKMRVKNVKEEIEIQSKLILYKLVFFK
jgi:hypothetical protein